MMQMSEIGGHEDLYEEEDLPQSASPTHFSPMLWIPHEQHQISWISDNVSYVIFICIIT